MPRSCSRKPKLLACPRSASPTATRWRASCARIGAPRNRGSPGRRLPARPQRRHRAAGLSHRPPRLFAAVPAAHARQAAARGKGKCDLAWHGSGGIRRRAARHPAAGRADAALAANLARLRRDFGDRAYLALTLRRLPGDAVRLRALADLAGSRAGAHGGHRRRALPRAAAAHPAGRADLHPRGRHDRRGRLPPRTLRRPPSAAAGGDGARCSRGIRMRWRARWRSSSAAASILAELRYQYPDEVDAPGQTPQQKLERLACASMRRRATRTGVPEAVERQLRHELALIARAGLRAVLPDRAQHRRRRALEGILCQGRGSAANSRGLLRARHHQHRPGAQRPAVRALRLRRPQASRPTSTSISSTSGARR